MEMLRYLYTVGYYLAVPVLLARMAWRSIRYNREYRARWQQRFGYVPAINDKVVWVHAVSMGETLAAVPLVKMLLAQYPDYRIVMTATTPTGAAQAIKQFGDKITSLYTPYDLPGCVERFLEAVHPDLGIILETELWPNLLAGCRQRRIPLLLANARLSEKSSRNYHKIAGLTRTMLNSFALVAVQADADGERFLALGLEKSRLQITGNIKFDIQLPADLMQRGSALREQWGKNRPVLVAASTHEGEEAIVLAAFAQIRQAVPNALLVLVPRHPERFSRVEQLCRQNYTVALRSKDQPIDSTTDIVLGDTMGELLLFYAAGDIAFVGGSFVPIGGHNLIEPAVLGRPVLTGPHLHNFRDVSQLLLQAGGAKIVNDADELAAAVIGLCKDSQTAQQMSEKARAAVAANTGALAKHLAWIERILRA